MGLKDWFTRRTPDPPRQARDEPTLPSAPVRGTITAFDAADGLGDITLDDGTIVRFGRSKCRGFDPIAGARVVVHELGPGVTGQPRALDVTVESESTSDLDRLHDERARSLGLEQSAEEAISPPAFDCSPRAPGTVFNADPIAERVRPVQHRSSDGGGHRGLHATRTEARTAR